MYKWVLANLMLGDNPVTDFSQHLIHWGADEILLDGSCYRNWVRFQPDGPLGLIGRLNLTCTSYCLYHS